MALVKTSKLTPGNRKPVAQQEKAAQILPAKPNGRARTAKSGARHEKLSERFGAATEELASGLTEAAAAAEELRRSMEQIAAGAEEAAGASEEQLAAIQRAVSNLGAARDQAEATRRRTEAVQSILTETSAQITTSVRAIERGAERQSASIEIIVELERRAKDIGEISRAVSRVAEQTSLLALNAAIEAARAGEHGRGFAVVADEVRALAETSEKSAQEVRSLSDTIQTDVRLVIATVKTASEAAIAEAKSGLTVVQTLDARRDDMTRVAQDSQSLLTTAVDAVRAAGEAQKGAEQIASAAEEQSSAAAEAQSAIQQQAKSLEQGQSAAAALAALAESVRAGRAQGSATLQIGAMAEELSATIQELSSAASQIMAAVDQINRGSQQQAAASHQASAALMQIEKAAKLQRGNASANNGRVQALQVALRESRISVERMVSGVKSALDATKESLATIVQLEGVGRRIEKIVDSIALIAIQTNMLAVSGSVEAARAGNAGRGFAVVSGDIRSLARESSANIDTVKENVRGVLSQIAALRRDSEQSIAMVEIEVQSNRSVFTTLEKMDGDVAVLIAANTAILESAEAIMNAAAETAVGARQVAAAAEESGAASRQAATASSQQAQGAEDLAAAIEEIASLAEELKSAFPAGAGKSGRPHA